MFTVKQIKRAWAHVNCFYQLPPPLNRDHFWPAHRGARSYWLHKSMQRKTGSLENSFHVSLSCSTMFWEVHIYIPCSTGLRQMFKLTSHRIQTDSHLHLSTSPSLRSEAFLADDCKLMQLKFSYINISIYQIFLWQQSLDLFLTENMELNTLASSI